MKNKNQINSEHQFEANHNYFVISIYAIAVLIIGALGIYIIWHFSLISNAITKFLNILSPFIVAFFIAYFINPLVKFIDEFLFYRCLKFKFAKKRTLLAIILAYVCVISIISLVLVFILPQIFLSITDLTTNLSNNIPKLYNEINNIFNIIERKFPNFDWSNIESQVNSAMPQFFGITTDFVTFLFNKAVNLSISVVSGVLSFLIAFIVSIYMLLDKHILAKNACRISYAFLSKNATLNLTRTIKDCNTIFYNFVIGKAIDSLIIGIITFIFMSFFKLDYSLLISVIVGLTNMIPYFGPFIGAVPGILILLIIHPLDALIFLILIIVIQQFDGLYLGPKILGGSVGLKPIWVILGITIGGAYGGILGMFFGVPIMAVISFLLNKLISMKLLKKNITLSDFEKIGIKNNP